MTSKKAHRKTGRMGNRKATPARAVRLAGMATTALAGALVMAVAAPQATAGVSPSVLLTTSSNPLQPVIDQIVAEMQQAVTEDKALPFATPESSAMLTTGLQSVINELVMSTISRQTAGNPGVFFQSPEALATDASDYRQNFQFFTPDGYYRVLTGLDPDATYQLTGTIGKGTGSLSISPLQVTSGSANGHGEGGLELGHGLVVNPDGTFTIDIGPTEPSGAVNYINDSDGSGFLTRDFLSSWTGGPSSLHIECISDCPAANPGITDTGLSSAEINLLLHAVAAALPAQNKEFVQELPLAAGIAEPTNTMSALGPETGFGVGLATADVSHGNFDLDPGEALIVKMPDVQSGFSGIELMNVFGALLPSTLAQTTLNDSQAFHADDGYTYYVISATNPGVANWLDTSGLSRGEIFMRYENVPSGTTIEHPDVTTQVVPVADVSKYLPTDTPTVSPEQFAADMNERVLSYDYTLDAARQSAQPGWVTQQLWMHDLQSAMGMDNFDKVFGEQPATDLWLRFTPALSPDMFTVVKDFLSDPTAAMTAIQDNLALAEKDISLPIQLAEALLQKDPGSFLSVASEALFDPNTGIIAGLLNARDDLATAIMAATKDGFASQAGPLATWEWQHMSELTQLSSAHGLADLGSLFNPGDLLGG